MNRSLWMVLCLTAVLLGGTTPSFAKNAHGWFVGAGVSMFELAGTGDISTPDGTVDFDVERRNAYGLITNSINTGEEDIGLGWENSQFPGGRISFGYRHNDQFVTHVGIFFGLPKNQELNGYPNPNFYGQYEYLQKQETQWNQSSFRLMIDWTPFEPLPLWYFTAGIEYARFQSRIEVIWEGLDNGLPIYRRFENYQDSGSAVGGVVGTGLHFAAEDNNRLEWFAQIQYAYVPFSGSFYAWDSDFLVGGIALEGGMRIFFPSEDDG